MLAYVVLNYDVKLPDGAPRPKNFRFGMADMPSKDAPVLFRKRTAQQSA